MFGRDKINDPFNTMGTAPAKPERSRTWIRHNGTYPKGYGKADEKLADGIFNARSKREAEDAIRKDRTTDGRQNFATVEAAVEWLTMRSEGGWVG